MYKLGTPYHHIFLVMLAIVIVRLGLSLSKELDWVIFQDAILLYYSIILWIILFASLVLIMQDGTFSHMMALSLIHI